MKKIVLFISLFFTSIIVANAEPCVHISGNGTNIGDEIACGTEHFYVISNDGENIRMMAKYNLLVGRDYYRVDFNQNILEYNEVYLNEEVQEKMKEGYKLSYLRDKYNPETDEYEYYAAVLYRSHAYKDATAVFFEETKTISEVYRDEEVQQYLEKGYSLSFIELSNYQYIGVFLSKNEGYEYKVVMTDEYTLEKELWNDESLRKALMDNYAFSYYIHDYQSKKIVGAVFYKREGYEFKTLILDKVTTASSVYDVPGTGIEELLDDGYREANSFSYTNTYNYYIWNTFYKRDGETIETITFNEDFSEYYDSVYEVDEVREYLEKGYNLISSEFDTSKVVDGITNRNYYKARLLKSDYVEYKSIFFDEKMTIDEAMEYHRNDEIINQLEKEGYNLSTYYKDAGGNYIGIRLEKKMLSETNKIYQSELAIGAHDGEAGKPAPDEIGIVIDKEIDGEYSVDSEIYYDGFVDYEYWEDEGTIYLDSYKATLTEEGYNILEIDIITVREINELVKEITGKNLPLDEWYYGGEGWSEDPVSGEEFYILGSIKNLMPEGYEWLWGTTYWTRTTSPTGYCYEDGQCNSDDFIYFIDTLGNLCAAEYCKGTIGAGLRPVVTIAASDVVYKIDTITDGHGTVKADYVEAKEGTVVKFTVEPMEGYVLGEVKVTDANGNVVIFKDYTFTMPNANVTIEATFIAKNPETAIFINSIILLSLIISSITLYKYRKKLKL